MCVWVFVHEVQTDVMKSRSTADAEKIVKKLRPPIRNTKMVR